MKVNVGRLAGLIDAVPEKLTLEMEQATVRELISRLAVQFGPQVAETLLVHNELRQGIFILVNGQGIGSLQGLETPLRDGDDVYILCLIAGG